MGDDRNKGKLTCKNVSIVDYCISSVCLLKCFSNFAVLDFSHQQGDLLAVRSSGAYGFTMSSSYNSRPRLAEIMVDGEAMHVIRERETIEQLMTGEHLLP